MKTENHEKTHQENLKIAKEQFREIWEMFAEMKRKYGGIPGPGVVAIATYTRENFNELRKGECYDDFQEQEIFLQGLLYGCGLMHLVRFIPVDAVEYLQFLSEKHLHDGKSSRAAYAAWKDVKTEEYPENA